MFHRRASPHSETDDTMWAAIKTALSGDERRVARRVAAIGQVHVDSRSYPMENWSVSGILFSGHDGQLAKGQRFKLRIEAQGDRGQIRSERRRVGKEWVCTCRFRWSPDH